MKYLYVVDEIVNTDNFMQNEKRGELRTEPSGNIKHLRGRWWEKSYEV